MVNPTRFYYCSQDEFTEEYLKDQISKYGPNLLVGVDPGNTDVISDTAQPLVDAIHKLGLMFHIYTVGPGMWSWSEEEQVQIKFLADTVGIDTSQDDWKDLWYSEGWKRKNEQQFKYYWDNHQAYSFEIDNLDSSSMKSDWNEYVKFFIEMAKFGTDNNIPTKLTLKNINPEGLGIFKKALDDGSLRSDFFAPWAFCEADPDTDPQEQIDACNAMGIRAITPINGLRMNGGYGAVDEGIPLSTDDPSKQIVDSNDK